VNTQRNICRLFIFSVLFSCLLYGCDNAAVKKVRIKNVRILAEIVDSDLERQRGLMFRDNLADNQGMLFIFDREARYNFWMKNMLIPLDLIWISRDKIIVDITKNALPCGRECRDISPVVKAKYVLEVNSGFAEKNQIAIGDKVNF
jgi:uncharacterized membrane protein (UPF0127 family)